MLKLIFSDITAGAAFLGGGDFDVAAARVDLWTVSLASCNPRRCTRCERWLFGWRKGEGWEGFTDLHPNDMPTKKSTMFSVTATKPSRRAQAARPLSGRSATTDVSPQNTRKICLVR